MSTFVTRDGTEIYYKDWGSGKPVLFSHGWPLDGDMWEYQMQYLSSRGYRTIAFDRRGFGRSSQPWDGYDYDTFADDIAGLIEHLDLREVTLVGFSMGGYVARELARIAPERVEALILIATSARGDTEELIRQRRSSLKAPPKAFKGLSRPAIVSSLHPDLANDETMTASALPRTGSSSKNSSRDERFRRGGEVFPRQSAMARAGDLERLGEIVQPTLIVAADADRLRSREEAEELHRGIARATLETVAHTGHMIPLEQPKALARVMTEWLKTLS